MARIYCPINSTWLPGAYSSRFGHHQVFRDNPAAGTTHFFRGMKKEEIPDLLRPTYSIGPHDTNYSICGRFNEEGLGPKPLLFTRPLYRPLYLALQQRTRFCV